MNNLSKEKRNHLILVVIVTTMVLAGLYLGLISFQLQNLNGLAEGKAAASQKLKDVELAIKNADQVEAELAASKRKIEAFEDDMAAGDLASWIFNALRTFKLGYKIDIPQYSQVDVKEMNLFPKFPYKQATLTVGGSGYYHDLGKYKAVS